MAQVRVACWNISFYTGGRAPDIQSAVYSSFSGRQFAPDIIALQEIDSQAALNALVGFLNTAPGSPGDWAAAPYFNSTAYSDPENALVYRTSRFAVVGSRIIAIGGGVTNQPRDTQRWDVRPVGYTSSASTLAIYNVHMKSGSTSDDNARRLIEAERVRDNAQGIDTNGAGSGLPAGYNFLVAGDFNMQSSSQTSYVELVGSQANNAGRFFDPINTPGSWNNNNTYRFVHTQDPAGAGGVDDRHDQLLISSSLRDAVGWHYIGSSTLAYSSTTWNDPNHSYRCWGNDGTSFNTTLTTTGNSMVGPAIAQALINVCNGAGHLPVYLDLRVPAEIGVSTLSLDFGVVQLGAGVPTLPLTVSNAGDTALFGANGIANLNYSFSSVAPAFSLGASGPFVDAAGGAGINHTASMFTATAGVKNATLTITSDAPDQPITLVTLTGIVNSPPVANAGADQTVTDNDNSGAEDVTLDGSLSSDPNPPAGSIASYEWKIGAVTIAGPTPTPTASVSLPVGIHAVTLRVVDNLGGVSTDTVTITVNAGGPPGCDSIDFNNDGVSPDSLDIDDFLSVYGGGPCSNDPDCNDIDFNNDAVSPDSLDIEAFLRVYGGGDC
jgi:endonuclease/exonuclease/phosphatase family metal-dependent hydrolase